jgi:hypothetical protein
MIVTPNVGEVDNLEKYLNEALTLRLYSNDYTPVLGSTIGAFTEVVGGGYVALPLTYAEWDIVGGDPTVALYGAFLDFNFDDATDSPGTIYGYYVTNAANVVKWAERFPIPPYIPVASSLARIQLRYTLRNQID